MDIVVLARMCVRRWYVLIVVLALAVAFAVVNYSAASPTYTAGAQLIVVAAPRAETTSGVVPTSSSPAPPSTSPSSGTTTGRATESPKPAASGTGAPNPLQNVQTTIVALVARMQAEQTVVRAGSGSATYAVSQAKKGVPLLSVVGTGTTPAAVRESLAQGVPATATALVKLQDDVGAPADSRFRVVTLNVDSTTSQLYPARTKGLVVTLAVGLLVAVLLATLTDAIIERTRRRPVADEYTATP